MSQKNENKPNNSWFRSREETNVKTKFGETMTSDWGDDETDKESAERLSKLFKQLDQNGNGRIDVHELTIALKGSGISQQYAEVDWLIDCSFHKNLKRTFCFFFCHFSPDHVEIYERIRYE